MRTTREALEAGYTKDEYGGWTFKFGDGYELMFEPLLFGGQMYVALYKDQGLLTEKVVVKPGFGTMEEPITPNNFNL